MQPYRKDTFYLIPIIGTIGIIWMISAILLLLAILYYIRSIVIYVTVLMFIGLLSIQTVPEEWAKKGSVFLGLRKERDSKIIYETESQYSYIAVQKMSWSPDIRFISQDNMIAGNVLEMGNIKQIHNYYMQVWSETMLNFHKTNEKLLVLVIGGGGYVFPRYMETVWPRSIIEVVEIDPMMKEAAIKAMGFNNNTDINIITMDARNYIQQMEDKLNRGDMINKYDYVLGDAFNNLAVPYHLLTYEFNEKIKKILKDNGVYMLNMIDNYENGRLLGAVANTLKKSFPYLYVVTNDKRKNKALRGYTLIGSNRKLDCQQLFKKLLPMPWILSDSDLQGPIERANMIVLTDNYAPVDNLLAPAIAINNYFKQTNY